MTYRPWFPSKTRKGAWEQQEFPFPNKERHVGEGRHSGGMFGADWDDDEDTQPGIGNTHPMSVGCNAGNLGSLANPASIYSDPSKKPAEKPEEKPREYAYSWTPGVGSTFKKSEEEKNKPLPPPPPSSNPGPSTVGLASHTPDYGSSHRTQNGYGASAYGYNRDNFHSGSGMGYKYTPPPPPETSDKIFIYDSTPGSMMRAIMERDGFIALAKTKPEFKFLDINGGEFPAMAERGKIAVIGELYHAVPRTLKMLDSMLDTPSTFKREVISLEDGQRVYAYIMPTWKTPGREVLIESGDWSLWKRGSRERTRLEKEARAIREQKEATERAERDAKHAQERAEWFAKHQQRKEPSGKKRIHVSSVKAMELRIMLHDNGHNVDHLDDKGVRVEAIRIYGSWFLMDADD